MRRQQNVAAGHLFSLSERTRIAAKAFLGLVASLEAEFSRRFATGCFGLPLSMLQILPPERPVSGVDVRHYPRHQFLDRVRLSNTPATKRKNRAVLARYCTPSRT